MSCNPPPPPLVITYVTLTGSTSNFNVAFTVWFDTLPKSLPIKTGVLWNNFGTLSKS